MTYVEGSLYKLQHDYYNDIKLECTYVEGMPAHTVWFVAKEYKLSSKDGLRYKDHYKLNTKTNKLYLFNSPVASWDTIENTLSECMAEDIWSKASASYTSCYNGMNEDLI